MLLRQKVLALLVSVLLFAVILDLVRRKKLREEYALFWLIIGAVIFLLAIWGGLLNAITRFIGIIAPINVLFFFGLVFLILICLFFSVKVSALTGQVKTLTQKLALLYSDFEGFKRGKI